MSRWGITQGNPSKPNSQLHPASNYHVSQNVGQQAATPYPESNARFRSFAERYLIERCRLWPEDEWKERAWATILQARTVYKMISNVGAGPDVQR